jgi:DNA-directed RNA polymerase specialized sigma24 family protein
VQTASPSLAQDVGRITEALALLDVTSGDLQVVVDHPHARLRARLALRWAIVPPMVRLLRAITHAYTTPTADYAVAAELELESLLEPLDPQERRVITLCFGFERLKDGAAWTTKELGAALELPPEQVRRIETQALEKMHRQLPPQYREPAA